MWGSSSSPSSPRKPCAIWPSRPAAPSCSRSRPARYGCSAMPISYLTRIVEFTATHHIQRADWSADRNAAEFGKAATDHPHRYQVRVTIRGPLEPERKGVVNLGELDRVLRDEITARAALGSSRVPDSGGDDPSPPFR